MKKRRQVGLTRGQQKDRETHIKQGQESWHRHIHKGDATWNDWMAIGAALFIGRRDAMAAAETEQPFGSRYNSELTCRENGSPWSMTAFTSMRLPRGKRPQWKWKRCADIWDWTNEAAQKKLL